MKNNKPGLEHLNGNHKEELYIQVQTDMMQGKLEPAIKKILNYLKSTDSTIPHDLTLLYFKLKNASRKFEEGHLPVEKQLAFETRIAHELLSWLENQL